MSRVLAIGGGALLLGLLVLAVLGVRSCARDAEPQTAPVEAARDGALVGVAAEGNAITADAMTNAAAIAAITKENEDAIRSAPGADTRVPAAAMMLACALCACGPRIEISRAALPCSDLVQGPLAADVPPADLPPDPATVADWQVFGDAQTGRLETSNLYRRASLDIIQRCEARDRALDEQLKAR